jgi:ABC-type uncharacterized transport system YnjBCD permease subunit
MHALQSPSPSLQPVRRVRNSPRPKVRKHRHPYRAIAVEATARLAVNLLLSVAAIAALVQLLPYQTSQNVKLKELKETVKASTNRVDTIQKQFSHYFDPAQVRTVMQEQTNRIDARKYPIVFQQKPVKPSQE